MQVIQKYSYKIQSMDALCCSKNHLKIKFKTIVKYKNLTVVISLFLK